VKNIPETHRLN